VTQIWHRYFDVQVVPWWRQWHWRRWRSLQRRWQDCQHCPQPRPRHASIACMSRVFSTARLTSGRPNSPHMTVRRYASKPKTPIGEWYSGILPAMFPIALLGSAVYTVRDTDTATAHALSRLARASSTRSSRSRTKKRWRSRPRGSKSSRPRSTPSAELLLNLQPHNATSLA